jgi:predicted nucleotide-binding protein (sugar kinase/HSP70/actin superfamily)
MEKMGYIGHKKGGAALTVVLIEWIYINLYDKTFKEKFLNKVSWLSFFIQYFN